MDVSLFNQIINDKYASDYKKLSYKYKDDFDLFLETLKKYYYTELPLKDFDGKNLVFIKNSIPFNQNAVKTMLRFRTGLYGVSIAEDEIIATALIENIDFSRDSVRKILKGMAPENDEENRILGLKRGLDFIADTSNKITEENTRILYQMTVNDFLDEENRILPGNLYRHDSVFIVGEKLEHTGLPAVKVPEYMSGLVRFINMEDGINDLVKAGIIHFYLSYIHPYFDGNGRMARLIHLWFLIQKGYRSALFIPFSKQIEKTRKAYYDAYTLAESNKYYSGVTDVTPFILYIDKNVYDKVEADSVSAEVFSKYDEAVKKGVVTAKEVSLWNFVTVNYGTGEFSTKTLEKDYGNAAYATIRSFVLKFEELGLFSSVKYGSRVKYKVTV